MPNIPILKRLTHTVDPLHFATFGGLGTKLLWFVVGLAISAFILTGTRLWYLRVHEERRPEALLNRIAGIGALMLTLAVLVLSNRCARAREYCRRTRRR